MNGVLPPGVVQTVEMVRVEVFELSDNENETGFGLNEAVKMLLEEGLLNVFARHDRHGEATRRAARSWGLEIQCADPRHYSSSLTAVRLPEGHSADNLPRNRQNTGDADPG